MMENRNRVADPMEMWRQWYEAGTRMWSNVLGGSRGGFADPYGLYRQWFGNLENVWGSMTGGTSGGGPFAAMLQNNPFMAALSPATARPGSSTSGVPGVGKQDAQTTAATMGAAEAQNLWKQWFEATSDAWREATRLGEAAVEITPRWFETLEQIRHEFLSADGYPTDPLQFATRWYNATSGPLSEFIGELIEREEFLEPSSQFLQSYASFYRVFRRNSEEYLKALSIPVRSDISRVAGLVVALEDKVDRVEEAFEDFEYGYAEPATAGSVQGLEQRLEAVEGKIDRLLAALESAPQNGAAVQGNAEGSAQGSAQQQEEQQEETSREEASQDDDGSWGGEVQATDAARRKARELGVDLSEVEGTGSGGQITVDDVRRVNAREEEGS